MTANLHLLEIELWEAADQLRANSRLTKLNALVNDIAIALPAEITAGRQQYQHDRDRLLTFRQAA